MTRSYRKNTLRTFKNTISRFAAVFAIVALGVGFLAGLNATPIDMKESMERYMDDGNFYDLRVVSTLGLTEEDVAALSQVDGVRQVQPGYSADLLVEVGGDTVVSRAHSLPAPDNNTINRLNLVEGRLPEKSGECVVEASSTKRQQTYPVGTKLVVGKANEDLDTKLNTTEYTVVGIVHNANYFSFEREPASVGNGTVKLVFYIPQQDFAYEAYTEVYLTADGALEQDSLGDAYQTNIDTVKANVEAIADARCEARYNGIIADARAELDDAWAEYNDAKAEADQQLADAAAELADGKQQLADGQKEVADGERQYTDGLNELTANEAQLNDGAAQLADAEAQLRGAEAQLQAGEEELAANAPRLEAARKQLENGQAQYEAGLQQYNDGLAQLDAAEQQLADAKTQLDANADAYQQGIDTLAAQMGVDAAQLDDFIGWLAQNCDANGTQPPKTVEELWQAIQDYGGLTLPDSLTQEQVDAIRVQASNLLDVLDAIPADTLPEEQQQRLQEAKDHITAVADAADPAAMRTALQAALDWANDSANELPEPIRDALTAAIQNWWSSLPDDNKAQLDELVSGVGQLTQYRLGLLQYEKGAAQLAAGRAELEANAPKLAAAKAQLDDGWQQYYDGLAQYQDGQKQLADARAQLEDGWATLQDKKVQLADARRQISDAKGQLSDARKQLDDAKATIAENLQKLRDGEIEYEDAKAEAEEALADARAQIEDGEAALNDVEYPTWYVWDRSKNVSYASFTANVDKLTAITTIFPVFFFLVAALVVSTTMTRMVEEERLQIGTLKALGYSGAAIMQKYLLYAFTAAAAGTMAGLAVGFKAFPSIIWSAYEMMYYMPAIATPWRLSQALFAGGTLIVLTVGITALACRTTLQENPAALMLPRAPKAGKRILLERITPLWRRLPFSWKVTCRNLLRYKKRFWMTVVGVAGCTSLLVAGFGISDSLNSIITKQYGDIYHYDLMTIVTKQEATESGPVYEYLYNKEHADDSLTVAMESTRQDGPDGEMDVYLMVPADVDKFADFADLHERISRKAVPLGEQGVVVTEKLAKTLGIKAGDTITLTNSDDLTADFTVSGVCEHYVSNYVYISPAVYEAGFGEAPSYNAILSILPEDTEKTRNTISADLLAMDNVASLNFTQDNVTQVLNMLNSIDAVVVLIIVCAASLAFVVLYNLSNINIAERVKEIATIKVLGFYDPEVYAYVNRESVALTLIGTLFGLVGGIALHSFVISTVEVDAVMFGREIYAKSFLYAIALTLLFSALVNLVMQRLLKRISMVESMKAPE